MFSFSELKLLPNFRCFVVWVLDSKSRASAGGRYGARMLRVRSCWGVASSTTPKGEAPPLPRELSPTRCAPPEPLPRSRGAEAQGGRGRPQAPRHQRAHARRRALTKGACAGSCHVTRRRCSGVHWILKLLLLAGRACAEVSRGPGARARR